MPICAKKLLKTRLPRGSLKSIGSGITGLPARDSTRTSIAPAMRATIRETMTRGCSHGKMFPPKLSPRIRNATEVVRRKDPAMSNPFMASLNPNPEVFARFGPSVKGVVKNALIKSARMTGT
jgi:hypothetical protein